MQAPRIDLPKVAPAAMQALFKVEEYISSSGLDLTLIHLVKMRASQINGCAYCLDMHSKDLRAGGETEQRLYCLEAWRETPFYTDREQAALEWAEALTLITEGHVRDEVFESVKKHFSEKELIDLTMAIVTINSWNRISIAFRTTPGTYQPGQHASASN